MKLRNTPISMPAQGVWLDGLLSHAPDVRGLAIHLHSSGHPPLGAVTPPLEAELHAHGFATLTLDLLTRQEVARDPDAPYNIPRLTERILCAAEWALHQPPLAALPLGLVAQDTGCAAAIRAAVKAPERFTALACLDGRADLAGAEPLRTLRCPVRFVISPGNASSAILEKAFGLVGGLRHWLALPDARDPRLQEQLLARAAATWLEQHVLAAQSATG